MKDCVFIVCVTILILALIGEPDLIDSISNRIANDGAYQCKQ